MEKKKNNYLCAVNVDAWVWEKNCTDSAVDVDGFDVPRDDLYLGGNAVKRR